jgi:hypothetical protein
MSDKPERRQGSRAEWMVAYVTHNISEGHIAAGRLQAEGIQAIIDHMAGMSAIGITIGSWGEVRVLVHPVDYDRALAILTPEEYDALADSTDDVIYYGGEDEEEDNDNERDD